MRNPVVGVMLSLLLLAGCSSNPNIHKPSPLPPLPADAARLGKQWSVSIGQGLAGDAVTLRPSLAGNLVIAASHDGVVQAVNDAGKTVWKQKAGLPLTGGVSAGYGMAVVGAVKGELQALNVADGKVRWTARLGSAVLAPALLTADKVIVQTNDGTVYALKAEDGAQVWTFDTPVPALSVRGYAPPLLMGDTLLVATAAGKVVALDVASGAGRWESQVVTTQGRSELARMMDIDGDMLLSGSDLYVVSYQGQLTDLDLQDSPRPRWQYTASSLKGMAAGQGRVYIVDTDGKVTAVDAQSGKAVWQQTDLSWRSLSNVAALGDQLVVGDSDGYLHVLAQADGRVLGRARVSGPVAFLQAEGEQLLVYSAKGQLSRWRIAGR